MGTLVLDQPAIDQLRVLSVGVEIRDQQGTLIGYYRPAVGPAPPTWTNTNAQFRLRNWIVEAVGLAVVRSQRLWRIWKHGREIPSLLDRIG
jgi:hypothetical protein